MKTGIELIAQERKEQIEKHGRTVERDVHENAPHVFEVPLTKAASALTMEPLTDHGKYFMKPSNWDQSIWDKMCAKPYKERLIIAGALIAAEIDRLNATE